MSALSWNLRLSKPLLPSTVHCLVVDGAIVGVCMYVCVNFPKCSESTKIVVECFLLFSFVFLFAESRGY